MATNKTTKREHFTNISAYLRENGKTEWADVIDHEIDLLNRKNTKNGERKVNEKMVAAKQTVATYLATVESATVRDVMAVLDTDSSQYATSVLTQMVKADGTVVRTVVKGKSHYALA